MALAAPESELEPIISELRALIREHINRARDLIADAILGLNNAT